MALFTSLVCGTYLLPIGGTKDFCVVPCMWYGVRSYYVALSTLHIDGKNGAKKTMYVVLLKFLVCGTEYVT